MSIIQLENIHFHYRKNEPVLSGININVPQRSIYGFLGANGSGKTTTIRLILGLLKAKKGTINLFNENIKTTYPDHFNKVGSLIENPSLYGHLSANDNLRIWAKYFGIPAKRIDKVLDLVRLNVAKFKKTEDFSTGMKQRLGLGIALLHDPALVILDEPTNGLDPMGIIELREVLNRLRAEGKTILLSSHILSEVEKIVTKLGIIKNGQIVFEGDLSELQRLRHQNIEVLFKVTDAQKALELIPLKEKTKISDTQFQIIVEEENILPHVIRKLVDAEIDIYSVSPKAKNLESMFLSITNEKEI